MTERDNANTAPRDEPPIHRSLGLSDVPSGDGDHQTASFATASGITLAVAVATAIGASFESWRAAST